ncbi:zinc finger BED domain-containing protein 6-like [Malaya genurostris]|uniref:zinc finger BED domain-containing protein 6-like n=1 Tax=Malaya genurostris TaxID=325434 RepID=UPI0026F3C035|nr:zinc finger BED domain-containing protein 6-like [Malaya genurostris]
MPPVRGVRSYFTITGKQAQCNSCGKKVSFSGNTTNLWKHLKLHHKILPETRIQCSPSELMQDSSSTSSNSESSTRPSSSTSCSPTPRPSSTLSYNMSSRSASPSFGQSEIISSRTSTPMPIIQPNLDAMFANEKSFKAVGERADSLEDALLYMVCVDNLKLSTPEKPGFLHFAKVAVPLWTPPSRSTLTSRLEVKFAAKSEIVRNILSKIPAICQTLDCWTERHTTSSYLGVTAHFQLEMEINSVMLGIELLTSSHTSEYLTEQILELCGKWGVSPNRVSICVTDSAANIVKAARNVFGDSKHMPCFAHTLNPYALGKTEGTMLRLSQDVITRWGSTYETCEKFLAMEEIISVAATKFPEVKMLSGLELQTLKFLRDIIRPFYLATKEVSEEKNTTLSKVIPIVRMISDKLQNTDLPYIPNTTGEETKNIAGIRSNLKAFLVAEMNRRFGDLEEKKSRAL